MTAEQLMAELEKDADYQRRRRESDEKLAARLAEDAPEWEMLRSELATAGIDPSDVGRFVNDTTHFRPSTFDERSAMPVLLEVLPRLSRPAVIRAVSRHLARPWARPVAFRALAEAFVRCVRSGSAGCEDLAGAAATTADKTVLNEVLQLVNDASLGAARWPLVYSLWRYKRDERAISALEALAQDPDVANVAQRALRRARPPAK